MFAQQVDAEFLACFCKSPLAVKREDIRKDSATLVVVHEFEKLLRHVNGWLLEDAVEGGAVVVVDACMLVVESAVENPATKGMGCEHASYEGPEFDVTMVELVWDWARKLDLNCLEAGTTVSIDHAGTKQDGSLVFFFLFLPIFISRIISIFNASQSAN